MPLHYKLMFSSLFFLLVSLSSPHFPTVLIHGIGGSSNDLNDIQNYFIEHNMSVYNIEIGNGKLDSIFMNMNKQCSKFNDKIRNLNITSPKINLLGISQGGLIARCYLERYSHITKPVNSLITYGTPHMGIYTDWIELRRLEYWKNPFKYGLYIEENDFLKYINNEVVHPDNQIYRKNVMNLNAFLVVWSSIDTVISPKESSKLEYFNITEADENYNLSVVPLMDSDTYKQDLFGLQTLDKSKKLFIEQYDCPHDQFKHPSCFFKKFSNHKETLIELTQSFL